MADIANAAEIAGMEAAIQAWYDHFCDIYRKTLTADQYGGQGEVSNIIETDVPCNIQSQVQTLRTMEVIGEQIESRQVYQVSVPPATNVRIHDRLVVTTHSPPLEMNVAAVLEPESLELERVVIGTLEGEPVA